MRTNMKRLCVAWAMVGSLLVAGSAMAAAPACTDKIGETAAQTQLLSNGFGFNTSNTRNQATDITADNVATLKVAFTHVASGLKEKRAAPAITEQVVYAAEGREVVAFNRAKGCEYWRFAAVSKFGLLVGNNAIRSSSVYLLPAQNGKAPMVFAGDFYANLYALDARTGAKVWTANVGIDAAYSWITGSPIAYGGTLFVPIATKEVVTTVLNVLTACCKSHGALQALDPYTGKIKWTYHTTGTAKVVYDAKTGFSGPNGMSLWGTPTVDVANNAILVGTGQNLSPATTTNSDSIVSIDMATGKTRWVFQAQAGDAWNGACEAPVGFRAHCPATAGRDLDFGAPAIMATLPGGQQVVLAGGKNAVVYSLDPKTGALNWKRQLGTGGNLGGVHWGMAVDDKRVFAAVADIDVHTTVQPVPGGAPGIYALDLVSGNIVWERHFRHTGQTSSTEVDSIFSSALSVSRDVLFAANLNGEVFALRTSSGEELWRFNTAVKVTDVGGVAGNGGTIDSVGPVPAGRELYINSGYSTFGGASDWMAGPGNALFVLRLP
jgi:polyvinyl alcohol dehydrogenase (cytochrome)